MKKMLLIVNPWAGMRKVRRYLWEILSIFNQAGWTVSVHMTQGSADAAQVAQTMAPQVDLVVCAGGDGTFNEMVTGVLRSGVRVPLGYIPCGSTNDFATSLKLSSNILQAARDIVEGSPKSYDIGMFGQRYFSYVASFGAFTRASYATPQNVKNALGHTAYVLSGISEISQIRKEHIRIELPDRVIEGAYLFGAISNSTSMGGILSLDPGQVDMGDGLFELLLVREPKNLVELHECIHALQTQTYNCSMLTFLSTGSLTIHADPQMPWTLDGEREQGHETVRVENLHHAIDLIMREKK